MDSDRPRLPGRPGVGAGARGGVADTDLEAVRRAGFDDAAIVEVVANVALHVFTNYFNRLAGTDLDFPAAPALGPESATAS